MNRKHKDLRHGQFIYNFLNLLHLEKGYPVEIDTKKNNMADPYTIRDDNWEELEAEYLKSLEVK